MRDRSSNILLVDDQPNNLLALEAILADLGENIVRASSGEEALRKLLENDFAVILLDVQMPGMDGFETARLIRERERSRRIPIIFITALSRNETNVFKGYSLGAVDYLFKPIVPEVLRSKVAFFVELDKKNQEIRQQAAELTRLNRRTELILNSADDGIIGTDRSGKARFVNLAGSRLTGIEGEKLVDRHVHEIAHPQAFRTCAPGHCRLAIALQQNEMAGCEEDVFWRADGKGYPVEYSISAMRDEEGTTIGSVVTFRDIHERKQAALARENERLYREAEASNKAKDDFLAIISHELRTPMTSILGWLDMLEYDDLDDTLRNEGWSTIRKSARMQAKLIDDLLDVSRIVVGKFFVERKTLRLREVLDSAIETVRPAAAERQVRLETRLESCDVTVDGDPLRLKQVFWNLLSNAIKFTPAEGSVSLSGVVDSDRIHILVHDTGIGIASDVIPHIFDRLWQADEARNHGGLGLGLAIVRHIVDAHGGTISVTSDGEGRGSTFDVSLPLAVREPQDVTAGTTVA